MFKGPTGPVSGRTSRSVAEAKNDAENFKEGPKYDIPGGHQITAGTPKSEYKELPMPEKAPEGPVSDKKAPFTTNQ